MAELGASVASLHLLPAAPLSCIMTREMGDELSGGSHHIPTTNKITSSLIYEHLFTLDQIQRPIQSVGSNREILE